MWEECKVRVKGDDSVELKDGILVGVMQVSDVIPPSPFVGGHTGGVVAGPVAVVKMDGRLVKVKVEDVILEPKMPIKDVFIAKLESAYAKSDLLSKLQIDREKNPVEVKYIVVHDTGVPKDSKLDLPNLIDAYFKDAGMPSKDYDFTKSVMKMQTEILKNLNKGRGQS